MPRFADRDPLKIPYESDHPVEHEVDEGRAVPGNHPVSRRVADVSLVPERDVFQRGKRIGTHDTGEAAQGFPIRSGFRLSASRRGPLLALCEEFPPPRLGSLEVTDLHRKLLQERPVGKDAEELGVPVTLDDTVWKPEPPEDRASHIRRTRPQGEGSRRSRRHRN